MTGVVEKYYRLEEVALLVAVCRKTLLRAVRAGEFPGAVNLGTDLRPDYRLPASEVNAWLSRRRVFCDPGVSARTTGELRRKAREAVAR